MTIPWESAVYDTDGLWSAGAATRLVVPAGATKVRLAGAIEWDASVASQLVEIRKNGAEVIGGGAFNVRGDGGYANGMRNVSSAVLEVAAGDTFELAVFIGTAGLLRSGSRTWFALEVVETAAGAAGCFFDLTLGAAMALGEYLSIPLLAGASAVELVVFAPAVNTSGVNLTLRVNGSATEAYSFRRDHSSGTAAASNGTANSANFTLANSSGAVGNNPCFARCVLRQALPGGPVLAEATLNARDAHACRMSGSGRTRRASPSTRSTSPRPLRMACPPDPGSWPASFPDRAALRVPVPSGPGTKHAIGLGRATATWRCAMERPTVTFSWQINLGHILVAISTLTAGTAAYVDLRRDIGEQAQTQAAHEARLEALTARMNAKDVASATLSARFGAVEELMREVRNDLREIRGAAPVANERRRAR